MEAEADWLALQTTRDPRGATTLFEPFVPTTLSDPNPPTWDYLLLENHPTIDAAARDGAGLARLRDAASAAQLP